MRSVWLYILGGTLVSFQSCNVQKSNSLQKNEYGLEVITSSTFYKNTVEKDTTKRLVRLSDYISPFLVDWKYASADNFTKTVLYDDPVAYLRIEAAEALQKVQKELNKQNLGIKIFDAYRPYNVTKKMWQVVPDDRYAANPAKGSGHNRGAAVDLTLIDLTTNKEIGMPTAFDDFTEKAHHTYTDLSEKILANRNLLRSTMEKYGFVALETEWWHYYLPNAAQRFELLDLDFKTLKQLIR